MVSSRSFFLAILALTLSAQALPHREADCQAPTSTVTRIVTVTARQAEANTKTSSARSTATNNAVNNNAGKTSSSAAAAAATKPAGVNNGGGNNGGGNNGGGNNGGNNNNNNNKNPQTSLTLDPRVIASGFANNGQDVPAAGQVPSLTSKNNFINFCLTVPQLPITNGKQITTGSCNPAPIGVIPSVDNMPSSKFIFPKNFDTIKSGQTFTIQMAIRGMQTGAFVNAQANYFGAPQQLNSKGQIIGHSHVVIESLSSLDQTTPSDPKKFVFFKGLNAAAQGGKLTADVAAGLAPGFYKLSSINTSSNHQPAIVPVAQHGSLDDAIYFTVTADGKPSKNGGGGGGGKKNLAGDDVPTSVSASASASSSASTSASASASSPTTTKRGRNNARANRL